jgi:PAS domain S-box-containing protein
MNTTHRILIVEDDAVLAIELQETLTQLGYQVCGLAATGKAAVESALVQKPDIILVDIRLRGTMTGIQAVEIIHQQVNIPVVYLTAFADEALLQQAKITDAYAYLVKPVRERELRAGLEMALYKHSSEQRLQHLNQILRAIREVNKLITRENDAQHLVDQACQILLRANGYRFVWIGQSAGDRLKPLAHAGDGQNLITRIVASATPEQGMKLPGTQAARTRRVVVCADMLHDERYAPWREDVERVHFSSTVAVPILHEERLFGVLSVYSDQTNMFREEELEFLLELTGDIAFGLKAIEREVERRRVEDELRESEERYRTLFEQASDGIINLSTDLQILVVNKSFARMHGYTVEEIQNMNLHDLDTPESARLSIERARHIVAGEMIEFEVEHYHKDGHVFPLSVSTGMISIGGQNIIQAFNRDITERKHAERALHESEERFRMLLQNVQSVAVQGYSMDGTTQYWNKASENLYGYTAEEAVGKKLLELIIPAEMKDDVRNAISYMVETGQPIPASELTLVKKDGTHITVYSNHAVVKGSGGVPELFCIDIDLSARKQAEAEIARMALTLDIAPNAITVHDFEGHFLYANQRCIDLHGYSRSEFMALTLRDLDAPASAELIASRIQELAEKGEANFQVEHFRKDGTVLPLEVYARITDWGDTRAILSMATDISERMQAEQAIRESEERFSTIFHASPIPILIIRAADGKFIDVNEAFQSMSGYGREEVIGYAAVDLNQWVDPGDLRRLERMLREQGSVYDFEVRLRTKTGHIQDVLMSATSIEVGGERYIMNLAYDITARKQHEIELHAIATLSAALRTAPSRIEMLPVIVEQLVVLLNCETVSIEIIDPLTGDAVIEAAHGIWAELIGSHQKNGTGINAIISQTRRPYATNDLKNDPNLAYPEWVRNDIQGCIGAPLIAQDQLIGFVWMGRRSEIVEAETRLFTAVADIAANALHRANLHEQSLKDATELVLAYDTTLEGWAHALELRDQETEGHTRRVTQMTVDLALKMGIGAPELENVRRGALLHDIGKMGIPDSVLLKPGTLNDREWEIMRRHPEYAFKFLEPINYLRPVLDIPYCHHEKWDGSGYPRGLKGTEIPLVARIFAIVDVWDALRSDRPYRAAWDEEKARKYIIEQSGVHFDPQIVHVFIELLEANNDR